jgi:hypothetical protein
MSFGPSGVHLPNPASPCPTCSPGAAPSRIAGNALLKALAYGPTDEKITRGTPLLP